MLPAGRRPQMLDHGQLISPRPASLCALGTIPVTAGKDRRSLCGTPTWELTSAFVSHRSRKGKIPETRTVSRRPISSLPRTVARCALGPAVWGAGEQRRNCSVSSWQNRKTPAEAWDCFKPAIRAGLQSRPHGTCKAETAAHRKAAR